jgi:hypothetical protein
MERKQPMRTTGATVIAPLPSYLRKYRRYLSAEDLIAIYGFTADDLKEHRKNRTGPPFRYFRSGKRPMYEVGALERWIAARDGQGEVLMNGDVLQ